MMSSVSSPNLSSSSLISSNVCVQEVAKEQGVTCMPTFKAYKKGVEVGKLEGADPKGLKKLVVDNM